LNVVVFEMIGLTLKGTGGFYPQVIRSINLKLAKQKKTNKTNKPTKYQNQIHQK